jgi:hypothetical protein
METLLCPRNIYVTKFTNIWLFLLEWLRFLYKYKKKQAHMFAVKAVIDQMDNFHLVDVGMRGNNK